MRSRIQKDGITVNAIAGTHVVFLGLNIEPDLRTGFRGFAIKRYDHTEKEDYWLKGMKAFESENIVPVSGETFSTLRHPIQGFQWADYSAKPDVKYTYKICCMYGDPDNLENRYSAEVEIRTEAEYGSKHSVFFNRGSVASQEYARRFLNKKPSEAGRGAYIWLSRGILESVVKFIKKAEPGDGLFGAIYEFQYGAKNKYQYDDIMVALKEASDRGVEVRIIFDDVEDDEGPRNRNRAAIKTAGIEHLCIGRQNAKLMHNKFFVLRKGEDYTETLTGSMNQTENGIFGHSNLVHIVKDPKVANEFYQYWLRLKEDPKIENTYREKNMQVSPIPAELSNGTTTIFSPRGTKLDSLLWYQKIAGNTKHGLFMTFAFGMNDKFVEVYDRQENVLKMALMETSGMNEKGKAAVRRIRGRANVVVAVGNRIRTNSFDRWLAEMDRIIPRLHVYWIHTKYMLVDPLSDDPIIVGGSANFSNPSTDTNDENMLIIKGDTRVADIYFGEYMRLFSHYSFREAVKRYMENHNVNDAEDWKPQFLDTTDSWMEDYFNETDDDSARCLRRLYFSGEMTQ